MAVLMHWTRKAKHYSASPLLRTGRVPHPIAEDNVAARTQFVQQAMEERQGVSVEIASGIVHECGNTGNVGFQFPGRDSVL